MKLSIITVTYNPGNSLISTLCSIEKQKEYDIELLIIDGGSTDNTINIANSYKNKFSSVIVVSEPDNGIYDAMNKGIDLCHGEYIYFLNAGDVFIDDDVLKRVMPNLDGEHVCYGDSYICKDGGNTSFRSGKYSKYRLATINICHQSLFYPKFLLESHKFNLRYRVLADYEANLYFWKESPFIYLNTPIVLYQGGGVSEVQKDIQFAKDYKWIILKTLGLDAFLYLCFRKLFKTFVPFINRII